MSFDSKLMMIVSLVFICITFISIVGMGIVTNSIFKVSNNTVTISDSELVMGKIALGFYWSLCVIGFVLSIYIYGFQK